MNVLKQENKNNGLYILLVSLPFQADDDGIQANLAKQKMADKFSFSRFH